MDFKMSSDFASAMVTVIPIVLLIAAIEFSTAARSGRDRKMVHLRQVAEALSRSEPEPAAISRSEKAVSNIAYMFWYLVFGTHIAAETMLVKWLAEVHHHDRPWLATFVVWVTSFGFVAVVVGGGFQMWLGAVRERSERVHLQAQIDGARAIAATATQNPPAP
ncbi:MULTISPECIES: hypothetical protein [Streptomyces]|uniref:hypothetical protein n=1 Tax=Streptomyces TaxID=1883 RepID=UPI00037F86F3|nr:MULTISPECIES: hypothetical protein [Streptomyces]MZD16801.1 hypothetical protein [Streptomyces sp. SID5476]